MVRIQPEISSTQRQAVPDLLKVAAIFAVVFIHSYTLFPFTPSAIDFSPGQIDLYANVLRFCVPVFTFLWAYFLEKSILKSGKAILLKRLYKILLPFICWTLVYTIIKADVQQMSLPYIFVKYWTGYGWSGQYYFIILFQFIATFPLWRWISGKLVKYIPGVYLLSFLFFILIAYSGFSNFKLIMRISDRIFIYWWPYVILGIIHARKNIFTFAIPVWLKIISVCLIPLEIYWLQPSTVSPYALPAVFVSAVLLLSLLRDQFSYTALPDAIARPLNNLANFTLGIFCLNPLVILVINHYFSIRAIQFIGASVILPLASTLIVFGICVLLILLLKKLKLGTLVST
jgi:fucose 4-O-acetylase-like acetyltransferase